MSVARFSEVLTYEPDLNKKRSEILEALRLAEEKASTPNVSSTLLKEIRGYFHPDGDHAVIIRDCDGKDIWDWMLRVDEVLQD